MTTGIIFIDKSLKLARRALHLLRVMLLVDRHYHGLINFNGGQWVAGVLRSSCEYPTSTVVVKLIETFKRAT